MNQYRRDAQPTKIVWDLSTDASSRDYQTGEKVVKDSEVPLNFLAKTHDLFYWLDVSVAKEYPTKGKLVVELLKANNSINIIEANQIDKFRILLNPHMLNLSEPIKVTINHDLIGETKVKQDSMIMLRTMLERTDKNEIYNAEINLQFNKQTKQWEIINV